MERDDTASLKNIILHLVSEVAQDSTNNVVLRF